MKTASSKKFTLIELLVVIAIIGILAGLIFPAVGTVRQNARKSKAANECQSLKAAIIMYESEFSCWPANVSGDKDSLVSEADYKKMCKILAGENSRKMVFFDVGKGYDENKGILDPWNRPYQVILDIDFDGKIDNGIEAISVVNNLNGRKGQDVRTRVAVYSYGVADTEEDHNKIEALAKKGKLVTSW